MRRRQRQRPTLHRRHMAHTRKHKVSCSTHFRAPRKRAPQRKPWQSRVKVATWNVNGIRARESQFVEWVPRRDRPDVVCLQELKATPEQLGESLTLLPEYWNYWHGGPKGYSGVSLHLRKEMFPARPAFGHPEFDIENRVVCAKLEGAGMVVASVYVPNGGKDYSSRSCGFLEAMRGYVAGVHAAGEKAHALRRPERGARWTSTSTSRRRKAGAVGQRPDEREIFRARVCSACDLADVGRTLDPTNDGLFTWWPPWQKHASEKPGVADRLRPHESCIAPRPNGHGVQQVPGRRRHQRPCPDRRRRRNLRAGGCLGRAASPRRAVRCGPHDEVRFLARAAAAGVVCLAAGCVTMFERSPADKAASVEAPAMRNSKSSQDDVQVLQSARVLYVEPKMMYASGQVVAKVTGARIVLRPPDRSYVGPAVANPPVPMGPARFSVIRIRQGVPHDPYFLPDAWSKHRREGRRRKLRCRARGRHDNEQSAGSAAGQQRVRGRSAWGDSLGALSPTAAPLALRGPRRAGSCSVEVLDFPESVLADELHRAGAIRRSWRARRFPRWRPWGAPA